MRFFDWHCDTLSRFIDGESTVVNAEALSRFEKPIQTFAIYTADCFSPREGYERAKKQLAEYSNHAFSNSILSIENCKMLIEDGKTLEKFNRAGVFLFSLTHNGENQYAGGCDTEIGLKPKGIELLRVAEELSMTLDVSHLSRRSFYDAVDFFHGPIIASHSCFDSVCSHRRNLTDEMAQILFERGGLVGINLYPEFVGGKHLADVAKQIEYACFIGGANHLAFGCDMDGIPEMPDDMNRYSDLLKLETELSRMGFSKENIFGIFAGNSLHFLEERNYRGFLQYQK